MQLFLAIDLPTEVKTNLDRQLKKIKEEYPDLRWVTTENFHVTLQFLGDQFKEEEIIKAVEESIFEIPAFHMYSATADLFIHTKITLYLGLRRSKELERIIEKAQEKLMIKSNKKFVPHITLARYKIPSKQQYFLLKKRLNNLEIDIDFPVEKICLFESVMDHGRPVYAKKAEFLLARF